MDDTLIFGDPLGGLIMNQYLEMYDLDHFIDLIPDDHDYSFAACHDDQLGLVDAPVDHVFGFNGTCNDVVNVGAHLLEPAADHHAAAFIDSTAANALEDEMKSVSGNNNNINEEENCSGSTTATKKRKVDRSRTLVCERQRRGRMKEKLYALRALVPNITKMDKASIIGDAVLYVQEMQMQAKKLKAEISDLEASIDGPRKYGHTISKHRRIQTSNPSHSTGKKITQMDIFQVEERGFYIRLVCNKEEGIAGSLYRALESLAGFRAQSSNLVTASDKVTLTSTLYAAEFDGAVNLQSLKLWVTAALLNQGFQLSFS